MRTGGDVRAASILRSCQGRKPGQRERKEQRTTDWCARTALERRAPVIGRRYALRELYKAAAHLESEEAKMIPVPKSASHLPAE
eukprot:6174914-Pleurochrysis_carterae.AAC.1